MNVIWDLLTSGKSDAVVGACVIALIYAAFIWRVAKECFSKNYYVAALYSLFTVVFFYYAANGKRVAFSAFFALAPLVSALLASSIWNKEIFKSKINKICCIWGYSLLVGFASTWVAAKIFEIGMSR